MTRMLTSLVVIAWLVANHADALGQVPRSAQRPPSNAAGAAASVEPSADPAEPAPYPDGQRGEGQEEGGPADAASVWDSPEMLAARNYIQQYSRRSVQFGPTQAREYLARLQQLTPEQQQTWLARFHARQAQIAQSQAVARLGRQQAIGNALDRIQTRRDAFDNINDQQTLAAEAARERLRRQQDTAGLLLSSKRAVRDGSIDLLLTQRFNPFDPTLDPAGRSFLVRKAGAAVTLPGDLIDANGNNVVGTDADIAAATPEGAAGYAGGVVPGSSAGLSSSGAAEAAAGATGGASGSP